MMPLVKVSDPHGDILIADSGGLVEGEDDLGRTRMVYRTAFSIQRGKVWTASTHDYAPGEPEHCSGNEGQQRRLDDVLTHARAQLRQCLSVGMYNAQESIHRIGN